MMNHTSLLSRLHELNAKLDGVLEFSVTMKNGMEVTRLRGAQRGRYLIHDNANDAYAEIKPKSKVLQVRNIGSGALKMGQTGTTGGPLLRTIARHADKSGRKIEATVFNPRLYKALRRARPNDLISRPSLPARMILGAMQRVLG